MPSLKDIRKRIRSVKNTQKITKAMKMVAAAKLRRAQDAIKAARPYSVKLHEVVSGLASMVEEDAHPLLRPATSGGERALVVVLTSDRGLCGGFNARLLRRVSLFLHKHENTYDDIDLLVVGRKGQDYFKRRADSDHAEYMPGYLAKGVTFAKAKALATRCIEGFTDGTYDDVYLAYNEFFSAIRQEQKVERVLPIEPRAFEGDEDAAEAEAGTQDSIFEPNQDQLLEVLLPKYVETQILKAMLDSAASEQGSRMTAMDSATNNAKDLINRLTLQYNRARQAYITKELVEITSGAEAL